MKQLINYKLIITNLPKAIEISGYRKDYIAKKMGISPQSFSAKISRNSFSVEDVEKLVSVIKNEDVEEYFMLEKMRTLKEEETISFSAMKNELGWN